MRFKPKKALPLILFLAAGLMSCADVPATGPEPPVLIAQFRFVHAAGDLSKIGVKVDGANLGEVAFKGAIPHTEFPAGNRVTVLSTGDTLRFAMESYKRGTVVILPKTGPVREFVKLSERRVFDPANTGQALLRIVHAAEAPDLFVKIAGAGRTVRLNSVAFKSASDYLQFPAGNYTITVAAASDTATVLAAATLEAANKRQTSVILGNTGAKTLALANFADD
jgi:hypothetical protein